MTTLFDNSKKFKELLSKLSLEKDQRIFRQRLGLERNRICLYDEYIKVFKYIYSDNLIKYKSNNISSVKYI